MTQADFAVDKFMGFLEKDTSIPSCPGWIYNAKFMRESMNIPMHPAVG